MTTSAAVPGRDLPAAVPRFDYAYAGLAAFFVVGLFVDGWAHNHDRVDTSFFTPWHAIFYSGFALVAILLAGKTFLNQRGGMHRGESVPRGYETSLIGVLVFAFGGLADMAWHMIFGIEAGVEALLSPSHLLLAIGMVLIAAGPWRAAAMRGEGGGSWRRLAPAVVSVLLVWSVISFITQFAHPMLRPWASIGSPVSSSPQTDADLYVMNADGSGQTRLTTHLDAFETHPAWSPDGDRLAFAADTGAGNEIFTMNLDGSDLQQLTDNDAEDWGPAWSPDGTQIAYASTVGGESGIALVPAGGGQPVNLSGEGQEDYSPTWSPDGTRIAFQRGRGSQVDIYVIGADGQGLENLTGDALDGFLPDWSPDGRSIAFAAEIDETAQIFVIELDSRDARQITGSEGHKWSPAWSPDGTRLAYVSDVSGGTEIYSVPLAGGEPVNLTRMPAMDEGFPRWSPDGMRILYRASAVSAGSESDEAGPALGVAAIILQSALLTGAVLLLAGRFRLPFGVFGLVFSLNALGMAFMEDEFRFVPAALLAGLAADGLLRRYSRDPGRQARVPLGTAFAIPLLYYGLYFAVLFLTSGVAWSIHFWGGAIVLAGLTGFLVAYIANGGPQFAGDDRV